jgi:hypothetical protein
MERWKISVVDLMGIASRGYERRCRLKGLYWARLTASLQDGLAFSSSFAASHCPST